MTKINLDVWIVDHKCKIVIKKIAILFDDYCIQEKLNYMRLLR